MKSCSFSRVTGWFSMSIYSNLYLFKSVESWAMLASGASDWSRELH